MSKPSSYTEAYRGHLGHADEPLRYRIRRFRPVDGLGVVLPQLYFPQGRGQEGDGRAAEKNGEVNQVKGVGLRGVGGRGAGEFVVLRSFVRSFVCGTRTHVFVGGWGVV